MYNFYFVLNSDSAVYSTSYGDMVVTIKSEPIDPGDFVDVANYADDYETESKLDVFSHVASDFAPVKRGRKKKSNFGVQKAKAKVSSTHSHCNICCLHFL